MMINVPALALSIGAIMRAEIEYPPPSGPFPRRHPVAMGRFPLQDAELSRTKGGVAMDMDLLDMDMEDNIADAAGERGSSDLQRRLDNQGRW